MPSIIRAARMGFDYIKYADESEEQELVNAIQEVDLSVEKGEFVAILGHNGSGKSTLIQHLNGLNKASSGRILVDGEDIRSEGYSLKKLRGKVGLVFQYPEYQLFEAEVLKDVCFGPHNQGLSDEEVLARAKEALAAVGLDESYYEKSPFDLSGGQKRRVAIAGILAMKPKVLVLDEPTAGMDPKGRDEILALLKELHESQNITVILVSHSMEDVAGCVGRIIVLDEGKILYDDAPSGVFRHARELEKVGLAAPQMTYVMQALLKDGWDVNADVSTVPQARDEILRVLNKG